MALTKSRHLGGIEQGWCRAVAGGTGTTVVAFLSRKAPDTSLLRNALNKIQDSHPVLGSKIHLDPASPTSFSFITPPSPPLPLPIQSFHLSHTSTLLPKHPNAHSPFHAVLEHELSRNTWPDDRCPVFGACVYSLPEERWALVLRFHTAACDRTTAVGFLRELAELTAGSPESVEKSPAAAAAVEPAIEDLVPKGKGNKAFWTRSVDMLGYSVKSLRLSNLKFDDAKSKRSSEVVRLQMDQHDTARILLGCKARGIKLCGALTAAGLIAAHALKRRRSSDQPRKKFYGVVTLTDCRPGLEPPLSSHDFGFYHAAVMNVHVMKGGEKLWDLAIKSYTAFSNSKKSHKHLSDMADLNFLMCKAIDNPGLTPSSSMRTSFLSVFEDTVMDDDSGGTYDGLGLEDYVGCSSVHGVGPSVAIFDTIRDGRLDCACVYPSPLHSRVQMRELIDKMRSVLVEASKILLV